MYKNFTDIYTNAKNTNTLLKIELDLKRKSKI